MQSIIYPVISTYMKEKKQVKKVGKWFIIIFFGAAIFLFGWNRLYWPKATLTIEGTTIRVLVAKSMYQQYRGLGKRNTIEPYDGMIFPFLFYGRQQIVMRDMRFPLDIIWLRDGVVVDFAQNVPIEPDAREGEFMIYRPRIDANAVLELPAGKAALLNLTIGTVVEQVR